MSPLLYMLGFVLVSEAVYGQNPDLLLRGRDNPLAIENPYLRILLSGLNVQSTPQKDPVCTDDPYIEEWLRRNPGLGWGSCHELAKWGKDKNYCGVQVHDFWSNKQSVYRYTPLPSTVGKDVLFNELCSKSCGTCIRKKKKKAVRRRK